MINNDTLEMLSAREQLMEDIDAIVDGELSGIISGKPGMLLSGSEMIVVCMN